jgi:glycosyltransferase involved in cell wall biosynthesis
MRILIFNWRDIENPEAGGAEVHLKEVSRRIASRGHEVVILSSRFPGSLARENIDGVTVVRLGGKYSYPFWAFLHYLLNCRGKFDVVVDDISKLPIFTPLFVKEPLVAIWHMSHRWILSEVVPWPLAFLLRWWEGLLPRFYRHTPFVAVSPSTRDELIQGGLSSSNVHVVFNGVDFVPGGIAERSPQPLVVYVGRVVSYKHLDHLLVALHQVRERVPDVRLVIAGRGSDYSRLDQLSKKLGLESVVSLRGPITEQEKDVLLKEAWVYGMTSVHEGWGISILEANVYGVPAVAYNVPGVRDAVINCETGILVDYGDHAALGTAIQTLCLDHGLRGQLGEAAVVYASSFSWDCAATRIEEILQATRNQALGDEIR